MAVERIYTPFPESQKRGTQYLTTCKNLGLSKREAISYEG
ncbi:hypothetical protein DYBT9623_05554 [Dyadobacter sp. CECT 9623]|uniref:Transposase n=1 Tax=Dyadobacter linearis TaxID=2823330 RepID=A0ABM8UZ46_9BACT|nr:hypothetical protein DYBT9623_05554 [Dyadobacter sp. CECT 9623]